tara:strand:- start:1861 stop:2799 length:939 start_codon:yes stop_codon:yes gene_type:complete
VFYSRVIGVASALPDQIVPNTYFERYLDTSDEWIHKRTGIRNRRWVAEDESGLVLVTSVLKDLIDLYGSPDALIVATCSPDKTLPSMAHRAAEQLGIHGLMFDVNSACTGFMSAFLQADALIKTGTVNRIAVIGMDVMSRLVDRDDRATVVLFGDGAAGVMMERSSKQRILSHHFDSAINTTNLLIDEGSWLEGVVPKISMRGQEVFRLAVRQVSQSITDSLNHAGCGIDEVDWFMCHQANQRIISALASGLSIQEDKFYMTLSEYGNTSSASIPLGLDHAVRSNALQKDQLVVLSSVGAGMSWASSVIQWR